MACDRFVQRLRDAAAGADLDPHTAAHLAVCPRCQSALARERRVLAEVERALDGLTAAAPSPDFVPRVRASIDDAPMPLVAAWVRPALASLAIAALVTIAVFVARGSRVSTPGAAIGVPLLAARQFPGRGDLVPAPIVVSIRAAHATDRRARGERPIARAAEVLVPERERLAMGRLVASLRAGRMEIVSALMRLPSATTPLPVPADLTPSPITIQPVVVPAVPGMAPSSPDVQR